MAQTLSPWGPWDPASPAEVAALFTASKVPWWIAGGHAIELAAGRPVRSHGDIDVMMLRRDQLTIQELLPTWDWQAADPPGSLRPWEPAERLPPGIHDIWCRPGPAQPWRIQIMLDESSGGNWISRRDQRIRRPIASIGCITSDGIPYLAPEIQLFYKAKNSRPKDETDFSAVLPLLTRPQRQWLRDALSTAYGQQHPWRAHLL
ncbi:MAG: nucleotidyltransferase domain-containing protein [Streptosporangiaceae bacterium]